MSVPLARYWALLITYLRPQRRSFSLLAALLLGGIALQLTLPQITRRFIDTAQNTDLTEPLTLAALAFISIAIIQQLVQLGATYFSETVAWNATNALRGDLALHTLRLDMTFHTERSIGELLERLDSDITALAEFFSRFSILVVGNLLMVFGVVALLLLEDWRMGLGFAVFASLVLAALASVRSLAIPYQRAFRAADAALMGYVEERLAAIEDIRSSGAETVMLDGLLDQQEEVRRKRRAMALRLWIVQSVTGSTVTLGMVVAFVTSYLLYQSGTITLGTAYLILNYAMLLNRPLNELTQQIDRLQSIGASIERVEELLTIQPTITDGPGAQPPPGALALAFEQVTFRYEDGDAVLKDIEIALAPGDVLGIVGRTGSGKTTMARLLARLYDVTEGRICLGGHDLRKYRLADLRERVALVTQDVQLFEASIRDNLTFFDPTLPDERLTAVLEALGLGLWLRSLPEGLATRLETQGRSLSAGEAQLLAFGRAFLRDPGLVILDEASARLDPLTEAHIETAVERLLAGRTGVIIAHRLNTVERCSHILVLEEGRVIEYDRRERLAADPNSRFAYLVRTGEAWS